MVKSCKQCNIEFTPKRSDQLYCSSTCKHNAYLERKALVNTEKSNDNHDNRRISDKTYKADNHVVERLIRLLERPGNSRNLESLLVEKDYSKDMAVENAKLQIRIEYMQKEINDLKDIQKKNTLLLEKYSDMIDLNESSTFDKFLDGCEKMNLDLNQIILGLSSGLNNK